MGYLSKITCFALVTSAFIDLCTQHAAATPLDVSKVTSWYCSVLKQPFDARSAMKSFPFDSLPVPTEVRKAEDKTVNVSIVAEGDEWIVEYEYQFRADKVDHIYGISLSASPAERLKNFDQFAMKWLRAFGEPELRKDIDIWYVAAGPDLEIFGRPFKFEVWSDYKLSASWFYPKHIKYAAELCSKIQ